MMRPVLGGASRMYQWWKFSGFSGFAFVALFVASVVLQSGSPDYDASIEDARAYFVDHGQRYLYGTFLLGLGSFLFFVPFVSGLSYFVRLGEAGPQINGRLVLIAGILLVAIAATASVPFTALAFGLGADADDSTIRAMLLMDYAGFNALPFAMGLMIGAASVVTVFDNLFWPWLGVVGFIIAAIDFIAPLGIVSQDQGGIWGALSAIAFLSFVAWMLLISYALMSRHEIPNAV
jgi:hypothetical protein